MIGHLLLERLARREQPRIPESELVMQQDQVAAFAAGGRDQGYFACYLPVSCNHGAAADPPRRHGAGSGHNQLARRWRNRNSGCTLHRHRRIAEHARTGSRYISQCRPEQSSILQPGDITWLTGFTDRSGRLCVICTMSLHHLPDTTALAATPLHNRPNPENRRRRISLADFDRPAPMPRPNVSLPTTGRNCSRRSLPKTFSTRLRAAFSQPNSAPHFRHNRAADRLLRHRAGAVHDDLPQPGTAWDRCGNDTAGNNAPIAGLTAGQQRDFNNFCTAGSGPAGWNHPARFVNNRPTNLFHFPDRL